MKKLKIYNVFVVVLIFVFFGYIAYLDSTIDYEKVYQEMEQREPFRYESKNIEVFVKDVWKETNSNVFKEDKFFIETNGDNGHSRIYITEELYLKLKENLKEPGLVNFSCEVMNGYLEGTTYNDYVIDIYDLAE